MPRIQFGSDGIRGLAGHFPLEHHWVVCIGQALARFAWEQQAPNRPQVVIGRDTRPSGQWLVECLCAGLLGQGVQMMDLGVMTTPGVAFLTRREEATLGVVVSASHSPYIYNGIKIVNREGLRLQREAEMQIEYYFEQLSQSPQVPVADSGQKTPSDHLIPLYIRDHINCCGGKLPGLRLLLDCAQGAAGYVAPDVFRELGAQVTVINGSGEGGNINYLCGSEYVRDHPAEFAAQIRAAGAQYGYAFDGDGDRLVVVDAQGRMYDGNALLYILAQHLRSLGLGKRNVVVTTDLANRGLEEALQAEGFGVVYARKGDRNLEAAMWQGNYVLGAEIGGNLIINDGHHTAADAIFAGIAVGAAIRDQPEHDLAQLTAKLKLRPQTMRSFEGRGELSVEQEAAIYERFRAESPRLDDWRYQFWAATTEPGVYRVMVEGRADNSQAEVEQAAALLRRLVLEHLAGNRLEREVGRGGNV